MIPVTGVHLAMQWIDQPDVRFVDCRFELAHPEKGEQDFFQSHIAGAFYAHLERDLSDMRAQNQGRHPLPSEAQFAQFLARAGIGPLTKVVAYDGGDGAYASRLWFLLNLCGHTHVTVLDGGFPIWLVAKLKTESGASKITPAFHPVKFDRRKIVTSDELLRRINSDTKTILLDARGPQRFRGEVEPLDKVAGHVPTAINRFYMHNLETDGRFKSPGLLRGELDKIIGDSNPANIVLMCGSGVTACQNLLALEYAGYGGAKVYAGSWSEWILDPTRPVINESLPATSSN